MNSLPVCNSGLESDSCFETNWIRRILVHASRIPWYIYAVCIYGFSIPVIALNLPGVGGVGAADLLMPVSFFVLIGIRRRQQLKLPHIALLGFIGAALLSLMQIEEFRPAVDCTIRWVRLLGILMPFFFGLFVPVNDRVLRAAFVAWMVGGGIAILIGVFLHVFQIEVRAGQQRLWMDGASILRAGGLIGNSGAFGHMTSTWAVFSVTYLIGVSRTRFRFLFAAVVMAATLYVIFISSSRAAMLHLFSAALAFAILFRWPRALRQWLVLGTIYGVLGIALMACIGQCMPATDGGEGSGIVETNLKRFVPGYGGTSAGEFTSNRAGNWPEYIEMMNEKALFGWGYKMGVRIHEESPDNSYLSVMLETGAIGFFFMTLFVASVFYWLIRLYRSGQAYAIVLIPVCVGQLFNCMTSDIYTFWITMPVVFMLIGLVIQREGAGPVLKDKPAIRNDVEIE